jgi:hypothetical protein
LVRVCNDAWVEERRRLERVLIEEIGAKQLALVEAERSVASEGLLHLIGTRLEGLEQVAVPALEVFEHIRELAGDRRFVEPEDPVDDMIGSRLVVGSQVFGLGRRLEWPDDHTGRIRSEVECLPI